MWKCFSGKFSPTSTPPVAKLSGARYAPMHSAEQNRPFNHNPRNGTLRWAAPSRILRLWPFIDQTLFQRTHNQQAPMFLALSGGRTSLVRPARRAAAELALTQYKKGFIRATFSHFTPLSANPSLVARPLPFLELTTPLVLAASDVAASYRHTSIARVLMAQAVRRALLVIQPRTLQLMLKGAMPAFASLWRQINRPEGELYLNPLTGDWVCDLALPATRNQSLSARFKVSTEAATNLSSNEASDRPLEQALNETFQYFRKKAVTSPGGQLKRYSFHWAETWVLLQTPHGYVKRKRARSIKKRMAKRLTSLAQRRYWVL